MNIKQLREELGFTQEELSQKTGIPRDRIAKWEQGKGMPKAGDFQKLQALRGKKLLEDVPRETSPDSKNDVHSATGAIIKIAESNKTLAEANKTLADAHHIIAKTNEDLVQMLKASTAGSNKETLAISPAMFASLLEIIADLGVGKKWKSKPEALAALNKYSVAAALGE